jgi:hypothetical protein
MAIPFFVKIISFHHTLTLIITFLKHDMMFKTSFLLGALAAIMLSAHAGASTVTLTGSCALQIVNTAHNAFVFNITNYGNGTATDLYLTPVLSGASTLNGVVLLPVVAPEAHYSESFYLYNFSMPGSYVEYFIADYTQGSSEFTTFFPCMLDVNQSSQSLVRIFAINQSRGKLNVRLLNYYGGAINAIVHVQVPSSFVVQGPNESMELGPQSQKNLSFNISTPEYTGASFPISVDVAYARSGVHYATMAQTFLVFGAAPSSSLNITIIAIAAVIAALLLLIVISAVKKRPRAVQNG